MNPEKAAVNAETLQWNMTPTPDTNTFSNEILLLDLSCHLVESLVLNWVQSGCVSDQPLTEHCKSALSGEK